MTWQQRDDNVQGYIYLLRAKGFHGIIPGVLLQRYKVGLSRNPETKFNALTSSQPPCDYEVVRVISVNNMSEAEKDIHRQFKACNVKLTKSREWFDLMPWQVAMIHLAFNRYEAKRWSVAHLPVKAIAGSLAALLGVGMITGLSFQLQFKNQTTIKKLNIEQN